jgi:hypothetical protein
VNRLSTTEPGAQLPSGSTPLLPPGGAFPAPAPAAAARIADFLLGAALFAWPLPDVTAGKGREAAEPAGADADPLAPGEDEGELL